MKNTQQCNTSTSGQQPQSPEASSQQVDPSGHLASPPGQITSLEVSLFSFVRATSCHDMEYESWLHVPAATSHVVPLGQQCSWSEQQTACSSNSNSNNNNDHEYDDEKVVNIKPSYRLSVNCPSSFSRQQKLSEQKF